MALYRKCSMASAIALAASLTACGGGGGGGGSELVSIPPPPATPTPTPTPTPAGTIGAAAMATVPNANLFPRAVSGGPTMQEHASTVFPLLQSVVSVTSTGLGANTSTMDRGATLGFDSTATSKDHHYHLDVPAMGISESFVGGGYYCYGLCGFSGGRYVELDIADSATSNLNWTTFGTWFARESSSSTYGMFVTGFETPPASVPTTGTATYNGSVSGWVMYPEAEVRFGVGIATLSGDAALQANFGSGSISGNLTNMTASGAPWNSVSLLGTLSGARNSFSGTSAATSAPGGIASLGGAASGTFAGRFFGPIAQELGAIWTLFDGRSTALGSITARRGP